MAKLALTFSPSASPPPSKRIIVTSVVASVLLFFLTCHFYPGVIISSSHGAYDWPYFHFPKLTTHIPLPNETCVRSVLPVFPNMFNGTRLIHNFDEILMIVFFNMPRYRNNVESFLDAYSEYFPNIVFVGTGSQENDDEPRYNGILVDTYRNPIEHANHLFTSALDAYPCYDGYLWVAYDVWLNIPHLTSFPLDKIWFALQNSTAIPSPGLKPQAPSPMLYWRDQEPYWHFETKNDKGADVCFAGLETLPRDAVANLVNPETGLVQQLYGGSSDAAYIPGRLRESFLTVLLSLSRCHLEIAIPTALTAVRAKDEMVASLSAINHYEGPLVDWIPNHWAEGNEIDAYHQWHWREADENSTKGGTKRSPNAVENARALWRAGFDRIREAGRD